MLTGSGGHTNVITGSEIQDAITKITTRWTTRDRPDCATAWAARQHRHFTTHHASGDVQRGAQPADAGH